MKGTLGYGNISRKGAHPYRCALLRRPDLRSFRIDERSSRRFCLDFELGRRSCHDARR